MSKSFIDLVHLEVSVDILQCDRKTCLFFFLPSTLDEIYLVTILIEIFLNYYNSRCTEDREIGQIRFELSFNISHDDLKPHITELAGYIASELNVDVSQVSHKACRWIIVHGHC